LEDKQTADTTTNLTIDANPAGHRLGLWRARRWWSPAWALCRAFLRSLARLDRVRLRKPVSRSSAIRRCLTAVRVHEDPGAGRSYATDARTLLSCERVILNLLQHLSASPR